MYELRCTFIEKTSTRLPFVPHVRSIIWISNFDRIIVFYFTIHAYLWIFLPTCSCHRELPKKILYRVSSIFFVLIVTKYVILLLSLTQYLQ